MDPIRLFKIQIELSSAIDEKDLDSMIRFLLPESWHFKYLLRSRRSNQLVPPWRCISGAVLDDPLSFKKVELIYLPLVDGDYFIWDYWCTSNYQTIFRAVLERCQMCHKRRSESFNLNWSNLIACNKLMRKVVCEWQDNLHFYSRHKVGLSFY